MYSRSSRLLMFVLAASLVLGMGLLFSQTRPVLAQTGGSAAHAAQTGYKAVIYFFWGDGCPHCAQAEPYLESLAEANPNIELKMYEVWYNEDNQLLFQQMCEKFGFEASGVPTTFIGDAYWVGYNDEVKSQIGQKVDACLSGGCADAGSGVMPGAPADTEPVQNTTGPITASDTINLPLIGKVNLSAQSMLVSTIIIALVDGVNPCSLWVLSMLLALTLHTGSRKRIIIIGLAFITVTALVYVLFITGLFSLLSYVSFLGWIQAVIALVALVFAVVNIKDYFFYKEGVSFTIADRQKAGILQKIRGLMDTSQSLWGLLGATILMAGGVSLVEFSCTAGFPVLWTNLLTAHNVTSSEFFLLLLVYMLIYQLDELVIFFTAVFTLRASKLEEKHGRILKLIGGMLMFTLALVMLIDPARMNTLSGTLLIFAIAFASTLVVLLMHRKVLPAMGIWIGSEKLSKKKKKHH